MESIKSWAANVFCFFCKIFLELFTPLKINIEPEKSWFGSDDFPLPVVYFSGSMLMLPKIVKLPTQPTFNWVVVSNIFYFHPYLGKIPNLTSIFFRGLVQPPPS